MPSPFDMLDGALSCAVMSAFGESEDAMLQPRTRSEYAEASDPARADWPIRGVFTEAHSTALLRGAVQNSEHNGVTRLSMQMAEFFLPAAYVAALPYEVRQGDKLAFPARAGTPVYVISDMQRGDTGDLNLILVTGE